jgi:DNA polymerase-3 subunit chi
VLIAGDGEAPEGVELLLNLGAESPPHFARFERLLEIVSTDDDERIAGRARFKFYRDRGYAIESHDLAAGKR